MKKRAFTLIEMMITLSIIALLATIAIPIYDKMILKARSDEAKAMIQSIVFAEERYRQERGEFYPSSSIEEDQSKITNDLKVNLSQSDNFTYFIKTTNTIVTDYNNKTNVDGNFTIKAYLSGTSTTKWGYTVNENNHYILFRYPDKLIGDYVEGGIDYEKLYYE